MTSENLYNTAEQEFQLEEVVQEEFFQELDGEESQLLKAESAVLYGADMLEIDLRKPEKSPEDLPKSASNHVFQEMAVVRSRLDFDEQEFRERCHSCSVEVSQKFKELVGELYDAVDQMIAEVSKQLHQSQCQHYQEMEQKLAAVRRNAVEAETVDQSIQAFLSAVSQAFQQSFNTDPNH